MAFCEGLKSRFEQEWERTLITLGSGYTKTCNVIGDVMLLTASSGLTVRFEFGSFAMFTTRNWVMSLDGAGVMCRKVRPVTCWAISLGGL